MEEAAKYFQNLNNLVSEPAGIQRRSWEQFQRDKKRVIVWSHRVLKVVCSFAHVCQLKLQGILCSGTSALRAHMIQTNDSGGSPKRTG